MQCVSTYIYTLGRLRARLFPISYYPSLYLTSHPNKIIFSRLGMKKTSEWVIARYKEDLSWIEPHVNKFDTIYIYNKGNDDINENIKNKSNIKIFTLPNIGREAQTYLHHFVTNYEVLSDIIVCTQGSVDDKMSDKEFIDMIEHGNMPNIKTIDMPLDTTTMCHFGCPYPWCGPLAETGLTFREYCEKYFCPLQISNNKQMIVNYYGNFTISKDQAYKYTKEQYKTVLENRSISSINPEDAYYLERLWYYIFYGNEGQKIQ